jgi:hypothetical protein
MFTVGGREVSEPVYRRYMESYFEPNPAVNFSFGGQSSSTPLNPLSFANAAAAQQLAGMLGPGYSAQERQLGGPFAYSSPMRMLSFNGGPAMQNAGLVQDLVSRYGADTVRQMLAREREMAFSGVAPDMREDPAALAAEQERVRRAQALALSRAAQPALSRAAQPQVPIQQQMLQRMFRRGMMGYARRPGY